MMMMMMSVIKSSIWFVLRTYPFCNVDVSDANSKLIGIFNLKRQTFKRPLITFLPRLHNDAVRFTVFSDWKVHPLVVVQCTLSTFRFTSVWIDDVNVYQWRCVRDVVHEYCFFQDERNWGCKFLVKPLRCFEQYPYSNSWRKGWNTTYRKLVNYWGSFAFLSFWISNKHY